MSSLAHIWKTQIEANNAEIIKSTHSVTPCWLIFTGVLDEIDSSPRELITLTFMPSLSKEHSTNPQIPFSQT